MLVHNTLLSGFMPYVNVSCRNRDNSTIDLHMQGGILKDYPMLDLSNNQNRQKNNKKISALNSALKKILTKNSLLIEKLENTFKIDIKSIHLFRSSLYEATAKISDRKTVRKTSGPCLIKGRSSVHLYDLLSLYGVNNFNWDWFISFFKTEISDKTFPKLIFEKLPKNTVLPSISYSSYDDRYWYKKLKESQKKNKKLDPVADINFLQMKQLYLLVLKINGLDFKLAQKHLHFD